jgi:hypothetical protein
MFMVTRFMGKRSDPTGFSRICGLGLRQQFPNCVNLRPRRQVLMRSRLPLGREDRVPMIRWIATIVAGATLSAGLAWLPPAASAAPQSAPPSAPQPAPQLVSPPAADAVAPALAAPPPAPSRKPHDAGRSAGSGNVMRGSDTLSLVATLPWWRPDASRPPGSDPGETESPILTACDVWLGFPFATADVQSLTVRLWTAQNVSEIDLVSDKVRVIDAGELNEIDLAAPNEPQSGTQPWLRSLLALVGGALAAFSAVRYLVA